MNGMIERDELTRFLADLYQYRNFLDYCENGLQVEGKENIRKIALGVSFSLPLLEKAIEEKADALIVHHGIFGKEFFKLTGILKKKVKRLLDHEISLYGIHLPMDGHPQFGHNALMLKAMGIEVYQMFEVGGIGLNAKKYSLNELLEQLHRFIHPADVVQESPNIESPVFSMSTLHGFQVFKNGPEVPETIGIISGGASSYYEKAIESGVDTYFTGDIKEHIPALSVESGTNFINLGHYYSEKPGVLALKALIEEKFSVETVYIEIANPI